MNEKLKETISQAVIDCIGLKSASVEYASTSNILTLLKFDHSGIECELLYHRVICLGLRSASDSIKEIRVAMNQLKAL